MDNTSLTTGGFTLPGEAGYEELTLRLAKTWGADVIRDSDDTQLSDEIYTPGYDIYSTVCVIRADNVWAKAHPDKLRQCCMMSQPVVAERDTVTVELLAGYFDQQFRINSDDDPKQWWQVFDRTTGREVPVADWSFDEATGSVTIRNTTRWHSYTVNFFSYRIWEEISMYNHVTNAWGDPAKQRLIVNDWGSYEFSVNPLAIRKFEEKYGYRMTSEDFIIAFVVEFGRKCVDLIHAHGKQRC